MRKTALAAVAAAAILAACNPSGQTGADSAPSIFPSLNSGAFRAEANAIGEDGQSMPIVMIRDGSKMRMEMNGPQGEMVIITNPDSGEDYVITNAGGRRMAMRLTEIGAPVSDPAAEWSGDMAANATRTGSCSVAGENGAEWTRTEEGSDPQTACVTQDGIILRATDGGRTVWETTSVQRGPQSAELFTLPPGVQVMDLGNLGAMIERAQGARQQ